MKYILCDIDGCCVDSIARLPSLLSGDYEAYQRLWTTDKPIPQGVFVYKSFLSNPDFRVAFITSRQESNRWYTAIQLEQIFGHPDNYDLWMRPSDDDTEDGELKVSMLAKNNVKPADVFIAFDDRNVVCESYRKVGITAYQTDTGY